MLTTNDPTPSPCTSMLHLTTAMVLGQPVRVAHAGGARHAEFTPVSVARESGDRTGWVVRTDRGTTLYVETADRDGHITDVRIA